ncbi:hypothetical protein MGN70_004268 [Eutypa lata]|nr:hypothetical protein MGN70_004268 [Eutypa lata]
MPKEVSDVIARVTGYPELSSIHVRPHDLYYFHTGHNFAYRKDPPQEQQQQQHYSPRPHTNI